MFCYCEEAFWYTKCHVRSRVLLTDVTHVFPNGDGPRTPTMPRRSDGHAGLSPARLLFTRVIPTAIDSNHPRVCDADPIYPTLIDMPGN